MAEGAQDQETTRQRGPSSATYRLCDRGQAPDPSELSPSPHPGRGQEDWPSEGLWAHGQQAQAWANSGQGGQSRQRWRTGETKPQPAAAHQLPTELGLSQRPVAQPGLSVQHLPKVSPHILPLLEPGLAGEQQREQQQGTQGPRPGGVPGQGVELGSEPRARRRPRGRLRDDSWCFCSQARLLSWWRPGGHFSVPQVQGRWSSKRGLRTGQSLGLV